MYYNRQHEHTPLNPRFLRARFPFHECYDTSAEVKTEDIYVDNGVVGCIIGPSGSRIKEIRKKSSCNIKVGQCLNLIFSIFVKSF